MLIALVASLTAQAAPAPDAFVAPDTLGTYTLTEPALAYGAMPAVGRDTYGEAGWFVTGLLLAGGGAVVMGSAAAVTSMSDNRVVDTTFSYVGLFGALHFVVGASMIGLELTEDRGGLRFTGTGLAGSF